MITANGKRHPSAPVATTVEKVVKTSIRYRVAGGGPFGGRSKKLTFTADEPCAGHGGADGRRARHGHADQAE